MNDIQSDEQARPRITLGKTATDLAQKYAGDDKVTGAHLDDAIREIQDKKVEEIALPDWLKPQLELMNTNILTLRYMVMALTAETEEQVQKTLVRMNMQMNKLQLDGAKEANLDHPLLQKMVGMMEQDHVQNKNQATQLSKPKVNDREM